MLKNISNYLSNHYVSRYWILLFDTIVSAVSSIIVSMAAHSLLGVQTSVINYLLFFFFNAVVSLIVYSLMSTHLGIIRHITIKEMLRVSFASILKSFIILSSIIILSSLAFHFSFSTWILIMCAVSDAILTFFLLIMSRIIISNLYHLLIDTDYRTEIEKVLIYGDSNESVSVFGMLDRSKGQIYRCAGFVVFNANEEILRRKILCGSSVFEIANEKDFYKIVTKYDIKAVIFPTYKSAREEKDRILDFCTMRSVKVLIKPTFNSVESGDNVISPIREIKIEDLLGREEIEINMCNINNFLTDKIVLVTGAAGSIGSQLCRQLLTIPIQKLILVDSAETPLHNIQLELIGKSPAIQKKFIIADVRGRERIDAIFRRYSPNVVFHAAAYKHVPMMEANPCEAVNVNVFGTKKVADAAVKYGVEKFVMISTDKAVNPANVMGASKRIAEIYVQSLSKAISSRELPGKTKFITTRFGNVLGSNGSVIPLFREQIAVGGPVTVTDPNIIRYFMTIPEACQLVLEAATLGVGDEIFVFDMGDPVKIVDLAKNMIRLAGLTLGEDIEIKYIGLRPGEKLYEELLNVEENTIPTTHKKIFLAKTRSYRFEDIVKDLDRLKVFAKQMDKDDTVATMKCIVPEYKSCNSRYGKFDID